MIVGEMRVGEAFYWCRNIVRPVPVISGTRVGNCSWPSDIASGGRDRGLDQAWDTSQL